MMTTSTPTESGESKPTPVAPEQSDPNSKAEVSIKDAQEGNGDHPSENENMPSSAAPVVSGSKRSRPTYKYDPKKITLRFLFANRDGLTVTVECNPTDTVGEVKGALLSSWPEDLPNCSNGQRLRLICMGKGVLMPDTRSLEDCQVPVFKSHPTPINVSVRPEIVDVAVAKDVNEGKSGRGSAGGGGGQPSSRAASGTSSEADQGCACIIL